MELSPLTTVRCLVISSTAQPFSTRAPVGQACTHLPQPGAALRVGPLAG